MIDHQMAKATLKRAGVRFTPQRAAVIDALVNNTTHPTIDQIYQIARERAPMISLATVYNTITALIQHGLIVELHPGRDGLRCDANSTPHPHAYCQQCGMLFDLSTPPDVAINESVPAGFHILRREVLITGLCAACAMAEA